MYSTQKHTVSLLALWLLQAGCSGQSAIPAAQTQVPAPGPAAASAVGRNRRRHCAAGRPPSPGRRPGGCANDARARPNATLRNADRLDRLVVEQSNPRSAQYRHWLSNEQFAASFAPSDADYRKVASSLQRAGFHIDATYANRTVLDASAPVGTIERYFETAIHRVRAANGAMSTQTSGRRMRRASWPD